MQTQNSIGSIWRKWDLHVHAPSSCFNNQFQGSSEEEKWEKYIQSLEQVTDIAVFGITDYFSIDGYKRVMEYKQQGRLANIALFIPNIELRIIPVSGRDIAINLHLIINPSIVDEVESLIFQALTFMYGGRTYRCTRPDIVALGREFSQNQLLDEVAAYKEGANQFKVDYTQLNRVVMANDVLHRNLLIAVSNSNRDGNSGLQMSNLLAVRREVYRMSNIILSGNPSDSLYFLGKGTDTLDQVINNYGSIKPCIMCSDAHSLADIGIFPNNRITWIKADTTFEGLMQIVYEPEERVFIGEQCPDQKPDYQVIESIFIKHPDFHSACIPLNPNLNVIIGGKSSGKSILLGCIAKMIGSDVQVKKDNHDYNIFIDDLVNHVTLKWRDSLESETRFIEYYPQTHINNLAAESNKTQMILKDIMKQEDEKAAKLDEYRQFCIKNKGLLNEEITRYLDLQSTLSEKVKEHIALGSKEGVVKEIDKLQSELDEIKQTLECPVSTDDALFKSMQEDRKKAVSQIGILNADSESLRKLKNQSLFVPLDEVNVSLSEGIQGNVEGIYEEVVNRANAFWTGRLSTLIQEIAEQVDEHKETISRIDADPVFTRCAAFYRSNDSLKAKNEALDTQLKVLGSIEKVTKEIEHLQQSYAECKSTIFELNKKFYENLVECADTLEFEQDCIKIVARIEFNHAKYASLIGERIDKRLTQSKEYAEFTHTTPEDFHKLVQKLFEELTRNSIKLQSGFQRDQMLLEVFSSSFYDLMYDVDYQGDVLSKMSEGKKSYIILRLLLEFGHKQCPILIDQPEDDLDNRSIYTELAQYLRYIKKTRQVIIVTHNPNVVVGADAEEVIVANQHGVGSENQDDTKFQYFSGSLETTFQNSDSPFILFKQGIKEHVCEILEGGEEAFRKRERKLGYLS